MNDDAVQSWPAAGLQNATFGNIVELILSIAALTKGLFVVVAMSLLGSVLSNLLLVLGKLSLPHAHCLHVGIFIRNNGSTPGLLTLTCEVSAEQSRQRYKCCS